MRALLAVSLIVGGGCGSNSHMSDAAIGGSDGDAIDAPGDAAVDADEGAGFRVGGSALGMRQPTLIAIDVGAEHRELLVTEDGPFRFPRRFANGSMYSVTTASTRCRIANGTGTIGGEVTTVELYCIGVVELANATFSPGVFTISPTWNPDNTTYGGQRPFFGDDTDLVSATPTALYPAQSTIAVYGQATTSGQPSTPHAYAGGIPIVVTHTATNLSLTYTIQPTPSPKFEAYVKASDPTVSAAFSAGTVYSTIDTNCAGGLENGRALAISGNTLVVGAPCMPSGANARAGAVYVYTRANTTWTFKKKLLAPTPATDALFGTSVAIDGDTLVVGSPYEDTTQSNSGAIFVFKEGGNNWANAPITIKASSIAANARFGHSVGISGTTLVAGAPGAGDAAGGTAYVFTFGTSWTLQQAFRGTNTAFGDSFAKAVAISGDRIICGAPDSNTAGGAAYIFTRTGTTWTQQQMLRPTPNDNGDRFGWSVSIAGTYAAIGAPGEDGVAATDNLAPESGAAYIYEWDGASTWAQQAYLKTQTPRGGDEFGLAVAVARSCVVVGTWAEDSSSTTIDSAPVFGAANDNVGAAYVFRRTTSWGDRHYIKAPNAQNADFFGANVAADGDSFVVGAIGEDSGVVGDPADNTLSKAGAVYVFR